MCTQVHWLPQCTKSTESTQSTQGTPVHPEHECMAEGTRTEGTPRAPKGTKVHLKRKL